MSDVLSRVRRVVADVLEPSAMEIDLTARFPATAVAAFGASNAGAVFIPESSGGQGESMLQYARAMVYISAACGSTSTVYMTQMHCAHPIMAAGTPKQIADWVPQLSAGTAIGAIALTEPGAGSDVTAMTTTAQRTGHGYSITGTKTFISNGDVANIIVLFATVDRTRGKDGITAFLVDTDRAHGLERGHPMKKLGQKGASTVELSFNRCEVSSADVLGAVGQGYDLLLSSVLTSRISAAAQGVGFARGALDATCRWLARRGQLASSDRESQDLQFYVAALAADVEAATALLERTAVAVDNDAHDAPYLVSCAKLHCTDLGVRVSAACLRILGEDGDDAALGVERRLRDAKITQIYDGTNQVQSMLIARAIRHRVALTGQEEGVAR